MTKVFLDETYFCEQCGREMISYLEAYDKKFCSVTCMGKYHANITKNGD